MKKLLFLCATVLLVVTNAAQAANFNDHGNDRDHDNKALVVTMSNDASANQLLVYDTAGNLVQTVPTQGAGGVSGNAGGVMNQGDIVAAINFNSQSVSLFKQNGKSFSFVKQFSTASKPVSVAFGNGHLYVLGSTSVESHKMHGSNVDSAADGTATLALSDGSSAQVGVLDHELLISEKGPISGTNNNGIIETVKLNAGAASGIATTVANMPASALAPFGLVTRGNTGYVTIAHSDLVGVVKNDTLVSTTPSDTQHAPCWLALTDDYIYSSNSPSMSISIYKVTGNNLVQTVPVAASLANKPTDIVSTQKLVAVIDDTNLSIFAIGNKGGLTLLKSIATGIVTNGVAIIE